MAVRPKCDSLLFQGEAAWEFTEPQWEVWKNLLLDPSEDVEEKYVCTFFSITVQFSNLSHIIFCLPPTRLSAVKQIFKLVDGSMERLDRAGYDGSFFRSICQADIEHYGSIIRWRGGLGEFLCNSGGYSYIITYATPVVCRRDYGPCMVMQAIISQVRTCGIGWCFLKDGDYHFYTEDEVEEILVSVGRSPSPSGEGDEHGASSPEPPRTPEPFIREHRGRLRERPKRKRWSSLYHTNF